MNILDFNINDLVVRVESAKFKEQKYNENLGIEIEVVSIVDRSYLGEPMKLLDIQNGVIYVEKLGNSILLGNKRELQLDMFADGWEYFVIPNGYTLEEFMNKKII
ncbi:MAG TPA: hypothetical protein VF941_19215 [Clostridia bacterium]